MLQCLASVLLQNLFWWATMSTSLATLLFFFVVTTLADVTIKSRSQWGAVPPNQAPRKITKAVPFVIIHHSATANSCGNRPCSEVVRSIQDHHMNNPSTKWADIGYNFLISPTGDVFEGRGWGVVGAHAGPGYNGKSVGICLLGNYVESSPPAAQLTAVQELISAGVRLGKIHTTYQLLGHRQVRATVCPGDQLYKVIQSWPHYSTDPADHSRTPSS